MFDRIAPRYDRLNRLLSLRRDVAWRRALAAHLPPRDGLDLLDLATGTADQILFLLDRHGRIRRAVGLDLSEGMLTLGRRKLVGRPGGDRVTLVTGDALDIPFPDASFDVVTMSFGIRNVTDVDKALAEIRRVLRPGGRALILEFSLPAAPRFRAFYLWYIRRILPRIGAWISREYRAYRYLNETIETFPCGEALCALLRGAGLVDVAAFPLTWGVATLYRADRAPA